MALQATRPDDQAESTVASGSSLDNRASSRRRWRARRDVKAVLHCPTENDYRFHGCSFFFFSKNTT